MPFTQKELEEIAHITMDYHLKTEPPPRPWWKRWWEKMLTVFKLKR